MGKILQILMAVLISVGYVKLMAAADEHDKDVHIYDCT